MLAITVGEGVKKPQGTLIQIENTLLDVMSIATCLRTREARPEAWWSPHLWESNYRKALNWRGAGAAVIDVDGKNPTAEDLAALESILRTSGCSLFHMTPKGARPIYVFPDICRDRDAYLAASRGAAQRVAILVQGTAFSVDPTGVEDLARLYFTPNSIAKGVERHAEIIICNIKSFQPSELGVASKVIPIRSELADAISHFNADHALDFSSRTCPMCDHNDCYGQFPDDSTRWFCWSSNHPDNVGIKTVKGCHGDALDIECYLTGKPRLRVLQDGGYMAARERRVVNEPVTEEKRKRPLRNNSPLTAYTITKDRIKDVCGKIELNEMTGRIEINRRLIKDSDCYAIRNEIELKFVGSLDKDGNEIGMKVSQADVFAAVDLVAHENKYDPLKEYMHGLKWDGINRLNRIATEILHAEDASINRIMVAKTFISAAARGIEPGCKVDTVLILVSGQGKCKSTFFHEMSKPWFSDTAVNIGNKDSYAALSGALIYEMAELGQLRRAKDIEEAKAFITSRIDTYRPAYGRYHVDVPRHGIIVGSTNNPKFLTDDTGNRRFWPVSVGQIDLALTREWKDQIWAESVHLYKRGAQWWLTEEEEALLAPMHREHEEVDPWEAMIRPWAAQRCVPFTMADVLMGPISKPVGQWIKTDELRVARILRRLGARKGPRPHGQSPEWIYNESN